MHVSSARRTTNAQDPSCLQEQSVKFPLNTSESISTKRSIPLCPDVQPAPVIVSPNRLTTLQNATSVSLLLKRCHIPAPLITQIASLPSCNKLCQVRVYSAKSYPGFPYHHRKNARHNAHYYVVYSVQGNTSCCAKQEPVSKKKDSDHSQLDYNSMESDEESYYYYSIPRRKTPAMSIRRMLPRPQ